MNGRYFLDTNILAALNRGEICVQERIASAIEVFVPCIVLGELYHGAMNSSRSSENTAKVDLIATTYATIAVDKKTARHYGEIKTQLRKAGRPIPDNDLWIAALGKQWSVTIASRDQHFHGIGGLIVEKW